MLMYADSNTLEFWVVLIIDIFVLYGWIVFPILAIFLRKIARQNRKAYFQQS